MNFVADTGETAMHAAAYRGANSVVQYLFDKGAKLDVVDKSGRTPLAVADGVEYGNSFAAQPQTAVLLRKLGAKEIPCPGLCPNMVPKEICRPKRPRHPKRLRNPRSQEMKRRLAVVAASCFFVAVAYGVRGSPQESSLTAPAAGDLAAADRQAVVTKYCSCATTRS